MKVDSFRLGQQQIEVVQAEVPPSKQHFSAYFSFIDGVRHIIYHTDV